MSEELNILLVDDHALFRSGIRLLLQGESGLRIAGEAADGLEAVKSAHQLKPDVVLLDLHLPGLSGLEALRLIKQDLPACLVMMLTVSEDAQDLAEALRSGADAYVLKNAEAAYLIDSIKKMAAGDSTISLELTRKLIDPSCRAGGNAQGGRPVDSLTPRERDVVSLLAKGESNKVIARHLDLSENTVKIHVQNILKKLSLSSRVQIAVYAIGNGFGAHE
ncbi:MAG: response regulator transcription factor [Uliginosibacterium sp.]|jgi:two-component system nitrate/nitrite response regulator NarL|nr:response regulator transcription factor [Uliginosibacterium sp.]MBK9393955.1 response regulator transcription factor [Uliginosibacterium sp.]MBK9615062.1 response regulator transcription factor [Uliginosibacterium sp.]